MLLHKRLFHPYGFSSLQCVLFLDTTSFVPNLVERRDHGFHIYRQLCLYLFKLGRRCIKPKSLPQESDLSGILSVSSSDARALVIPDFLARSKLDQRLSVARKLKAEKDLSGKPGSRANLPKVIKENKDEFGRLGRSYVAYLFHAPQSNLQLTSDIVKGLGSFDLDIMFCAPLGQALYCFKQLFRCFHLRNYFQPDDESLCTEEYLSFLHDLRKEMPELRQPRVIITDAVSFISRHDALQSRSHLLRIFRLSCLCLDESYTRMPIVKFGPVSTDDPKSKLIDTILPVQSFFINVGRGIDALTTSSSASDFLALESTFGDTAFSDTYNPWEGLDHFSRADIVCALKPGPSKRRADTRDVRLKNPKSGGVSKGLPRRVPRVRLLSANQISNCHWDRVFPFPITNDFNCSICTFVFICICILYLLDCP